MTGSLVPLARRLKALFVLVVCMAGLAGCAYGDRIKREGAPAPGEYAALVQNAVEQYQSRTGVLPIRNVDANGFDYEKYRVDFAKLQDARLLSSVPLNAFENGGTAVYVLVRIETKPQVKLLDLVSYQQAADIQRAVDSYQTAHKGELPKGAEIAPGYWSVDFGKLNRKEEQARSPISNRRLRFVLQQTGKVGIDYAPDILPAVGKKGRPDSNTDLRELLLDEAFYVPARSFPYRWSGGSPKLSLF